MKEKLNYVLNVLVIFIFISSFVPLYEILIGITIDEGYLWSYWTLLAIITMIINIEAEIYFFRYLQHTKWWVYTVMPKLSWNGKSVTGGDFSKHRFANLIRDFEYIGLALSIIIINLSKVGAFMFVLHRKKLPYGRLFLYIGCVLRAPFEYYGIGILIEMKDLMF